jgi:antitoxin (DNA-binding transcriptional repressor) of toxin-antitoxin stability system
VRTRNISQFKAHISQELLAVRHGERIIILDRDIPVAEVIPYEKREASLVPRAPTGTLVFRKLGISVGRDPLDVLREERDGR